MAESQGKGLKTPVNGLFHKNFEFEPLFGYDNFQNKIDTWETTVERRGRSCQKQFLSILFITLTCTVSGSKLNHLVLNSATAMAGKAGFTLASAATAIVEFMA